jgi:positive regulator of sigma E activity
LSELGEWLTTPPLTWDIMHQSIIHLAILLAVISPFSILVGAVLTPPLGRASLAVVFTLLLLGTASLFSIIRQVA